MAGDGDRNARIGWRHEWATIALLWAMVVWVSVTILGTKGAAASYVTLADAVVVMFALAGGVIGTLTIVRAARIPLLSAPLPAGEAEAEAEKTPEEPDEGEGEKGEGADGG